MLNKVLVPLDGSPLATCVLPHLVAITRATDAAITLLRVTDMPNERTGRVNPVDWHLNKVEAKMYLDEIADKLSEFTAQKPDTQVLEGPAAERIIEYAQKNDFDLVVLSTHGQSGLDGWNISSVAQKVINRVGKSILLVPAYQANLDCQSSAWGAIHYRQLLAPLDGSQRAECVLPVATAIAQKHEANLILAHVVARPEMMQRMPLTAEDVTLADQLMERNQAQVSRYFEQLETRLEPRPRTQVLLNEHVTATLQTLVEREQVDLVLLCAHGTSGQNQWPYGSVVTSFITYGATPLLVVQDLPVDEIAQTQAERATHSGQNNRSQNNGSDELYDVLVHTMQNGSIKGLEELPEADVHHRNYGINQLKRVGSYVYAALL